MPPIRTQSSQKREEQEGRILLAIQAIKNQEIASIQEVATRFNVPRTTLRRRLAGYTNRAETRANSYKLTEIEENLFKNGFSLWILAEQPLGLLLVREMANLLLAARGSTLVISVGENWVTKFVKRHPRAIVSILERDIITSALNVKTQKSFTNGLISSKKRYFNTVSTPTISITLTRLDSQ